jgi:hypothetical protein
VAWWSRRTLGAFGVASLAGALMIGAASRRWGSSTGRLADELLRGAGAPRGRVSFQDLDSLPPPVGRYFRAVLRDGQPYIRSARVAQTGEFRSEESLDPEAGWHPFEATQLFTTEPPGFVWDARIRMAPLVSVRVRDGYVAGRASMRGALLGIVKVVDAADEPGLRAGALQRYLAESVWFPTALLPRQGLVWSPIDESRARATLTDGETSVSLDFEFAPGGEIVGCYTAGRLRAVPGQDTLFEELPWGGGFAGFEKREGIGVPLESEVYWVVGGRERPYYRGRNVRVAFDYGEAPMTDQRRRGL